MSFISSVIIQLIILRFYSYLQNSESTVSINFDLMSLRHQANNSLQKSARANPVTRKWYRVSEFEINQDLKKERSVHKYQFTLRKNYPIPL